MREIIFLLITLVFVNINCTSVKLSGSYYVTNWTTTIDKKEIFTAKEIYISYNDCLFEFILKVNIDMSNFNDSSSLNKGETVEGVFVLKKKRFYEFDKFDMNGKLVSNGYLKDKEKGIKLPVVEDVIKNKSFNSDAYYGNPIDTTIQNIEVKYSLLKTQNDTIEQKFILLKNKNFNTVYSQAGIFYPNNNYKIIGVIAKNKYTGDVFTEKLVEIREITKDELEICKFLINEIEE